LLRIQKIHSKDLKSQMGEIREIKRLSKDQGFFFDFLEFLLSKVSKMILIKK